MSRYSLKACERKVTIRFDMEERIAHIYTSEPMYMRRLDKLVETLPDIYKCVKADYLGYYKKYECPMKFIKFGGKPRVMSEEQKAQLAARFKKATVEAGDSEDNISDEDLFD